MGKTINLRDSKNNKFTRGNPAKGKETRKNILIAPSLHQMIRDVIIEEETSMKGFASVAIDRHIDEVADMGDKPCFENAEGKTVNTTVFLPRELAKEVKRTASHAKISENELMVRCLMAGLKTMKDKYPEIIIDIILK
jgi:hypothetical protein